MTRSFQKCAFSQSNRIRLQIFVYTKDSHKETVLKRAFNAIIEGETIAGLRIANTE